jgi:D-lactate dehydrogenase (cytochrome)
MIAADVIARLKAAAGGGGWSEDQDEIAPLVTEWREMYRGATPLLLKPNSVEAISQIVGICAETRTPLVPQGGNTGLVGGQTPSPDGNEILLSLKRLNRIRNVDALGNTMTLEAGVILVDAQAAADGAERLFPMSLGAEGSATIGGLVSTNAGGVGVLAYGNMRELTLGLEAVLPDGRVWNGLSPLRKDNTGYDLKQLLIGGEGTLGIVTAASVKLFAKPARIETAFVAVANVEAAVALLSLAQRLGGTVSAFELIPRLGLEFVLAHLPSTREPLSAAHPWYVLIDISCKGGEETGAGENLLVEAANKGLIADGTLAQSHDQRRALWKLREEISGAQKPEGGSIKHDVSVPVTAIPAFIERAGAAVAKLVPGARPVAFGHIGDGNIHFNVSQPIGADRHAFLARRDEVSRAVHDIVVHEFGGSISAEHGVGQMKVDEILRYKSREAIDAMRAIKRALDPLNIMNPGKVVRV